MCEDRLTSTVWESLGIESIGVGDDMRLKSASSWLIAALLITGIASATTVALTIDEMGRAHSQVPASAPPPAPPKDEGGSLAADVSKEIEKLRGWRFKQPVKTDTVTPGEVRRFVERQIDKSLPAGKLEIVQAFLRTIGLIPPAANLKDLQLALLESQVAGFYDPDTKSMRLVSRGTMPPFVERMLLAHELTHALDDQYANLKAFAGNGTHLSEDVSLARGSVTEGSATALMFQYMVRAQMSGQADLKSLREYAEQEKERSQIFEHSPKYFLSMVGTYICGTQFLARSPLFALMLAPDNQQVGKNFLAAINDPPLSTEQILHPDKYWVTDKRDDPVIIDDVAATTWLERDGRMVVHRDTVGEMLTTILTTPSNVPVNLATPEASVWSNASASGWGGDRFYLLAAGGTAAAAGKALSDLKGVWVTTWDTTADRDEFVAAVPLGSFGPRAAVQLVDAATAIVYFGFDESERAVLTKRYTEKPVPMKKGTERR